MPLTKVEEVVGLGLCVFESTIEYRFPLFSLSFSVPTLCWPILAAPPSPAKIIGYNNIAFARKEGDQIKARGGPASWGALSTPRPATVVSFSVLLTLSVPVRPRPSSRTRSSSPSNVEEHINHIALPTDALKLKGQCLALKISAREASHGEKKSDNGLHGPQEGTTSGLREGKNDTDPGQDVEGEHTYVRGRVPIMELVEAIAYRDLNWNLGPSLMWH